MLTSFSLTHKPAPFPAGEGGVPGPLHFSSSPAAGRTDGRRQSHPQPDWKPTGPREPRPSRPTTPWRWRKGRGLPPGLPHRPPAGCPRQKEALGGWGQRALEAANTSSGGRGATELAGYRWERDAPRPRHAAAGRARPRKKGAHLLPLAFPALGSALTRRRAAARPAPEESREAPGPRAGEGRLGVASGRSGRSLPSPPVTARCNGAQVRNRERYCPPPPYNPRERLPPPLPPKRGASSRGGGTGGDRDPFAWTLWRLCPLVR